MTQRTIGVLSLSLFVVGLLWGGYTFLVYLGVPVHGLVYLQPAGVSAVDAACGTNAALSTYLCRGSALLWPFLSGLFTMASPFFAYVVVSIVLYVAFFLFYGLKTGYFSVRLTLRPIVVIALFACAVWLIGTTLSFGSLNNFNTPADQRVPFQRFFEPTKEAYNTAGPQALDELKANFTQLNERGCLSPLLINGQQAQTQGGTKAYTLSALCIQGSLFTRVGSQFVMVLFLLLNLLVAGGLALRALRVRHLTLLLEGTVSICLGALFWVAALWLLAVLGHLTTPIVRVLFVGLPLVAFPVTWRWLRALWSKSIEVELRMGDVLHVLAWLLLSYLALNFLNVVRPFPIGWDDLGSYLNRPRLLASYGAFIPSMSQFQWEYLTSLGYTLFGFNSVFGSTFAMQINWMAGLLAALSVFVFGRTFFGPRAGFISAMCYYFLPMTGHFSFADMKIDNAVFFTSTVALLAAVVALSGILHPVGEPQEAHQHKPDFSLLFIAGLIAGFAFAIKPTAILSVLLIFSVLSGALLGAVGFAGMVVLGFVILSEFGPLNFTEVASRAAIGTSVQQMMIVGVLLFIAAGLFFIALYRKRANAVLWGRALTMFILGIVVACLPWMAYNAATAHNRNINSLFKAEDLTAPQIVYSKAEASAIQSGIPVHYLPNDLKLDPNNAACKTSARTEELDRYWGFDHGLQHYLTLPWRQVMNSDAVGYYVTLMPALLLFPLLLLLPFFWSKQARWLRLVFAGGVVFLVQWMLVGNGVMWYGLGMFLVFAVGLEAFIARAPDQPNRILFSALLVMSILVCLVNRLWQFDSQRNLFEYPLGKVTASALREMTIPEYDDITNSVLDRHQSVPNRPYTYRMGTFISYFIPKNREILPVADHQLGMFNCLNQERNHALTLKRLAALGFNSMIFDTNTATIEKDPNGSLHQKVQEFLDFANDPTTGVKVVINDPGNGIAYILLP